MKNELQSRLEKATQCWSKNESHDTAYIKTCIELCHDCNCGDIAKALKFLLKNSKIDKTRELAIYISTEVINANFGLSIIELAEEEALEAKRRAEARLKNMNKIRLAIS